VRALLDTHIWLWSLLDPDRLGPAVRQELEDESNELWLSPISVWETVLLADKGRLRLEPSPEAWVDARLRAAPMREAVLNRSVALASRRVELAHEDPADRFLAATAAVYDLTLVTADTRLIDCPSIDVLANR
jgi:PIN domain nuclease of toxin-antitoxin system